MCIESRPAALINKKGNEQYIWLKCAKGQNKTLGERYLKMLLIKILETDTDYAVDISWRFGQAGTQNSQCLQKFKIVQSTLDRAYPRYNVTLFTA